MIEPGQYTSWIAHALCLDERMRRLEHIQVVVHRRPPEPLLTCNFNWANIYSHFIHNKIANLNGGREKRAAKMRRAIPPYSVIRVSRKLMKLFNFFITVAAFLCNLAAILAKRNRFISHESPVVYLVACSIMLPVFTVFFVISYKVTLWIATCV